MPGGVSATSKSQESGEHGPMRKVAKGHSKVTVADIVACKTSTVKSGGHCPAGSHVLIVSVNSKDYALSRGHKLRHGQSARHGDLQPGVCWHYGQGIAAAAQAAFFGDLVEINIVENGANGYLTAAYANETAAARSTRPRRYWRR